MFLGAAIIISCVSIVLAIFEDEAGEFLRNDSAVILYRLQDGLINSGHRLAYRSRLLFTRLSMDLAACALLGPVEMF